MDRTDVPPTRLSLGDITTPVAGGLHCRGSAAAIDGRAVLATGPSGSGKTQLVFALMALGATLIADDAVILREEGGRLSVQAHADGPRLIEARGIGLLHAPPAIGPVPLALVVSLDAAEPDRLPPSREVVGKTARVPLILAAGHPNLAPVILHLIRYGRAE